MMKNDLLDVLEMMQGKRILVLGDMVADIYLQGDISRISREAPVLVLEQTNEKIVAGGAANVVNNIASLGGKVFATGILGLDHGGQGLKEILSANGAVTEGLFCDEKRPTITKTRIIAGGRATVSQQVVRIDRESRKPVQKAFEEYMLQYVQRVLPDVDAVVLSDYGSGTVTKKMTEKILRICKERGIITIVDSRYAVADFKGVDYVKQNDAELAAAVGYALPTEEAICEAGTKLLQQMEARGVLITRGSEGMTLFEADGAIHNIPVSDKSEVYDVSGAGDTCVAAMILALASGAAPAQAAELSNYASGIAVRKLGTATVSRRELQAVLQNGVKAC